MMLDEPNDDAMSWLVRQRLFARLEFASSLRVFLFLQTNSISISIQCILAYFREGNIEIHWNPSLKYGNSLKIHWIEIDIELVSKKLLWKCCYHWLTPSGSLQHFCADRHPPITLDRRGVTRKLNMFQKGNFIGSLDLIMSDSDRNVFADFEPLAQMSKLTSKWYWCLWYLIL